MKRFSVVLATLGVGLMLATSGCHEEGPAEKAGEKLDKAMDDAGDAMKDAGKTVREKVEDAGDRAKDAAGG